MRRLVLNETPEEIALEVGMTAQTVRAWMKEPLFLSEMSDLMDRMEERIINDPNRLDALEILENAASHAAKLCVNVMKNEEEGAGAPLGLRMKSAWDILDRAKGKPVQRQVTTTMSISDLIIAAHDEMRDGEKTKLHKDADDAVSVNG